MTTITTDTIRAVVIETAPDRTAVWVEHLPAGGHDLYATLMERVGDRRLHAIPLRGATMYTADERTDLPENEVATLLRAGRFGIGAPRPVHGHAVVVGLPHDQVTETDIPDAVKAEIYRLMEGPQ